MKPEKKQTDTKKPDQQKNNGMARKIIYGIIGLIMVLVLAVGWQGYQYFSQSLQPLDLKSQKTVEIKIPIGSSSKQIGNILEEKKIIKSGFVFNYYVKKHGYDNFKAGYYEFKPSMTLKKIAEKLEHGGASAPLNSGKILVREGVTADQIGSIVEQRTKFSKKQFLKLLNDQTFLNELAKKYPQLLSSAVNAKNVRYKLEGYLYPATYTLGKKESLKALITEMVAKSNQVLQPYYPVIAQKKWTVQKTLTLASLVEREGVTKKDRYRIAGVFENRLDQKMKIQSDISVLYALNTHKQKVTYRDLKVNSPYNLYKNQGVGPGPFNNPSLDSIKAVLYPKDRNKDYLYFIANLKTGKVYFSKTYVQHQELAKKLKSQNNN